MNQHGVVLEGWPSATFDSSNLGLQELEIILATLVKGKCIWRKLTEDEWQERQEDYITRLANGEVQVRKQKKRSDAGKKRKRLDNASAGSDDDDDNSDDDDDNSCSNPGPEKRRRTRKNISSKHVVSDVDED